MIKQHKTFVPQKKKTLAERNMQRIKTEGGQRVKVNKMNCQSAYMKLYIKVKLQKRMGT